MLLAALTRLHPGAVPRAPSGVKVSVVNEVLPWRSVRISQARRGADGPALRTG